MWIAEHDASTHPNELVDEEHPRLEHLFVDEDEPLTLRCRHQGDGHCICWEGGPRLILELRHVSTKVRLNDFLLCAMQAAEVPAHASEREGFTKGLDGLNQEVAKRWPGTKRFAALSPERQVEIMRALEKNDFFQGFRGVTLMAIFGPLLRRSVHGEADQVEVGLRASAAARLLHPGRG